MLEITEANRIKGTHLLDKGHELSANLTVGHWAFALFDNQFHLVALDDVFGQLCRPLVKHTDASVLVS